MAGGWKYCFVSVGNRRNFMRKRDVLLVKTAGLDSGWTYCV